MPEPFCLPNVFRLPCLSILIMYDQRQGIFLADDTYFSRSR